MSENIKKSIKKLEEVQRCFVKVKEDEYRLHDKGGNLPTVHDKYERTLRRLKISYVPIRISRRDGFETFLRYWDKKVFEEVEETLPCYEYCGDKYVYIGDFTHKVPTKETIEAANELKKKVNEEIEVVRKNRFIWVVNNIMKDKNAAYIAKADFKGAAIYDGQVDHYYVFVNKKEDGTFWKDIVIFDLNKIYKQDVSLEIPERYSNRILGNDNTNANLWIDKLGIDKLEIIYN